MKLKKFTQKDRYGNTTSYEFEGSEKPLDPTRLLEKQMELDAPDMTIDMMSMAVPPVMGEEFNMGDPNNHPGEPMGSDTVPAWLTPGEFVVNKEATEMFGPEIEAMNEVGKMAKGGQVQYHADGAPVRGSAAQIMAGMDPASIVRMMGNLGNAYQYIAPALGMQTGGAVDDAMDFAGPESLTDAQIAERMAAMRAASPAEEAVPVPGMAVPEPMLDALLHSREGFRDDVYLDSLGKPTVGYGHLLGPDYADQVGDTPFTQDELDSFFREDRETAESAAKRNVGEDTWNKLNKRQKATLSSMAFQLGEAGQKKFKNMIKAIQNDDYREAAKQALTGSKGGKSKWLKQTPVRALDLAEAFDPTIAAQYRDAGGVVFDDMPVQYAFLGDMIKSIAGIPEPGEIQWSGDATPIPAPEEKSIWEIEEDERRAQQSRAGLHVENAQRGADVAAANLEQAQAALDATPLTDTAKRDALREEIAAHESDLAAATAAIPELEAQQIEDEEDFEIGQTAREIETLDEAIANTTNEEDLAALEAQKAALENEIPQVGTDEVPPVPEGDEGLYGDYDLDAAMAEIERQDELDAYTSGQDQLSWQKVMKEKQSQMKVVKDAADAAAAAANEEAGGDNPAAGASDEQLDKIGKDELAKDPTITENVRKYLEESPLGKEIGGALGSFFDAGELTKMAVYVAGSMAFGASPMQAMNFGVQKYIGGLESKQAAEASAAALKQKQVFEAAKTGKFTQESIINFQKTNNPAALVPTDTTKDPLIDLAKNGKFTQASLRKFAETGNPLDLVNRDDAPMTDAQLLQGCSGSSNSGDYSQEQIQQFLDTRGQSVIIPKAEVKNPEITKTKVFVPGQGLTQVYKDQTGKQIFQKPSGEWMPVVGSGAQVYDPETMGRAAMERNFSEYAGTEINLQNTGVKAEDETFLKINPKGVGQEANSLFQKYLSDSKFAVEDADRLRSHINSAIDDMVAYNKAGNEPRTTRIKPFLDARMISVKTGIDPALMVGANIDKQFETNEAIMDSLEAKGFTQGTGDFDREYAGLWKKGAAGWAVVEQDPQLLKKFKAATPDGQSPFTFYMNQLINDKGKYNKDAMAAFQQTLNP